MAQGPAELQDNAGLGSYRSKQLDGPIAAS